MTRTTRPDPKPFGPSERRRVLKQAREAGELAYDKLDRMLLESCETERKLDGLIRSLRGVTIVPSDDPDDPMALPVELDLAFDGPVSDREVFHAYSDQVRRLPRLTRADEQILARRLEFHQRALDRAIAAAGVSDETRENMLSASNCASLTHELDSLARRRTGKRGASTLPCLGENPSPIQCRCAEYNRVREYMTERNLYLVVGMAHAYRTYGLPLMDLVQEGNASLIRAVEKFDWRKGVRFQTYAAFWIRQAIERLITANRGMVRVPNYIQQKLRRLRREGKLPRDHREVDVKDVSKRFEISTRTAVRLMETDRNWYSLDAALNDDEGSQGARIAAEEPEAEITEGEKDLLGRRLDDVMTSQLSDQERDILALRFGLGGRVPETLDQIGERMSLSRERIRQMQMKALEKLSKPHLMEHLEDFL